jgi:Flp pilus assembly pilin Flp
MRNQRGQSSAEYLGVIVLVAVIIGVLATTDIGTEIKDFLQSVIGDIGDGGR